MKKILFKLIPILSICLLVAPKMFGVTKADVAITHPFLIVRAEQFPLLRERSKSEPWKSMMEDALRRSEKGCETGCYTLQEFVGAAALASVLDCQNARLHAMRVRDAILNQYSQLQLTEHDGWGGVVPPMGSFFMAILSLDVVYQELTTEEIQACESVIESQIFKINRKGSWGDVRLGTHGTWDIYKGNRKTPDEAYYQSIMAQITEDGVSPVTNHYAWERVAGGDSRLSKSGYMDVLEFTGIDNRYYNNERLQKFFCWLFGSSINCSKEMAIFGDMLPQQSVNNDMLHRRVGNFDQEAAGYAAWLYSGFKPDPVGESQDRQLNGLLHGGVKAKGNILTYMVPIDSFPLPVEPQSKIYPNGGAFFREEGRGSDGLHGVLYNIRSQAEWHTHNEVNGLALSGMGNRLLVNGGRLGEPVRAAQLNNTLTVNSLNHSDRVGGGIVEGFTNGTVDYACGFSGKAIDNAQHFRSLLLVHATDKSNPYFILLDEVAASIGDSIQVYLHPANESGVEEIDHHLGYDAVIDHFPSKMGAHIRFFYATPPSSVKIGQVASAVPDRYPGYPYHSRLEASYGCDADGKNNALVLLVPYVSRCPVSLTRLGGDNFSGAMVVHATGVEDVICESDGNHLVNVLGCSFTAKALMLRHEGQFIITVFARAITSFRCGKLKFHSEKPASLFLNGSQGNIVSSGGHMKITWPGIGCARFDAEVEVVKRSKNHLEIIHSGGLVKFEF